MLRHTYSYQISYSVNKLNEIIQICNSLTSKHYCTKSQLQSLLGSLLYISKCVQPARFFLNRMLAILRQGHDKNIIQLTPDFGVTYYDTKKTYSKIYTDASLTGLGGCFNQMVFSIPFPRGFKNYNIIHLEMLNVVVAINIWGTLWQNKNITIRWDDLPVVEVLNTSRARDAILAACTRNIWLLTAKYNIHLTIHHIQCRSNTIADLLSRWFTTPDNYTKLNTLLTHHMWVSAHIDLMMFNDVI